MNGRLRQAMALGFMRASPYDIRPNLLLYVVEQDDTQFPVVFGYGCRYLAILFRRHDLAVPDDVIHVAVMDALEILRDRKASATRKERAVELGLREEVYGAVRQAAVRLYERRYMEAAQRVQSAMLEEAA